MKKIPKIKETIDNIFPLRPKPSNVQKNGFALKSFKNPRMLKIKNEIKRIPITIDIKSNIPLGFSFIVI